MRMALLSSTIKIRIATYDACCQRLTKSGSARQESWTSRTIRVPGSDN
jgi:hypothetical protein